MIRFTSSPATPSASGTPVPLARETRLTVASPEFEEGARIPKRHASRPEGENVAPGLEWSGAPEGTKQFVLIVDDPDAGGSPWTHWVVHGIPGEAHSLAASRIGVVEGKNDFGRTGWGGPLPPRGRGMHRYRFRLSALDAPISPGANATRDEVIEAMRGHVLAEGELVGTYAR